MKLRAALALGRVSNLPTVWSNALVGLALGGADLDHGGAWATWAALAAAVSLSYVGGMYLNDAFDRGWDALHRPERPIPAGQARVQVVFAAGFAMLAAGLALVTVIGWPRLEPALAGLGLAALIVIYDLAHKGNPLAPLLMAACRVMVYVIGGWVAAPALRGVVLLGGAALLLHVAVLSAVARREAGNPRLPALVALLIAGISLVDAALLALKASFIASGVAVACFIATRLLQRRIAGT
jgi:4-hydroxybenzoate polyprenyltransferase